MWSQTVTSRGPPKTPVRPLPLFPKLGDFWSQEAARAGSIPAGEQPGTSQKVTRETTGVCR